MTQPKPVFKSLRRKRWLQRWSVGAPRMTIKNHLPWPLRAVFIAIVLGLGGAIALWTYDQGRNFTGFKPAVTKEQYADLQQTLQQVQQERDRFEATVNASESRLNIEHALQAQLTQQIKSLQLENGQLKDDLSFFESLLPTDKGMQGVAIRRFRIEMIEPTQLRYQLLIMQGGRNLPEFAGNYQLVLTLVQKGKSAIMTFPKAGAADKFTLSFPSYQRIEGMLTIPEDAVVKSVQVKIFQKGALRAQQFANL
tara:strand:+ start:32635 stop:33390 length:756 start_codon:yes stop_codon:yes gene_type:complete